MDALTGGDLSLFEGFRLDRQARVLCRRDVAGAFVPIAVGSRALEVLDVLVGRAGDLVSRDEFMSTVWPATAVEDTNLNVQIAALRRILDQGRADGSCIQTIPGRGYRFAAAVTRVESSARLTSGRLSGNGAGAPIAEPPAPPNPAAPVSPATSSSLPIAAPRLSIVVLPFTNLSNDPEQQYFADGITEDVTTDLSRIAGMFVISRSTAFTYKDKRVDAKQIGRELCVRYVLEGSVRRSGQQVRVNAQLVDSETGAHLWAERLDRDVDDLFRLQNEITGQIARALQFELAVADAGRLTEHPDALDYVLRGRASWWKLSISRENIAEGLSLFERALALDPRAVDAQIGLAHMLVNCVLDFPSDESEVDLQRADEVIARALAVSPNSAWAHYVKGQVLRAQSQFEDAAIEYETATAFDRNLANAYAWLGRCKLLIGSVDEVIPLTEYAIRLSPHDRNLAGWYWQIGAVHLLKARTDEAVRWLEKARSAYAGYHFIHASLAAGYAIKGETKRASVALREAQRLRNRYSSIAGLKAAPGRHLETLKLRALAEATYFAGLRKAGMPEE
jgi:TolB-like protein